MPRAHIGDVERWLQDHDTYAVNMDPPVINTWYEVFHEEDVRHLYCVTNQENDEVAAKLIELRFTIDGNVYFGALNVASATLRYWYRDHLPSAVGTAGLRSSGTEFNAGRDVDKRGLDYKVEIRITAALGTNQTLDCWCVIETQEIT